MQKRMRLVKVILLLLVCCAPACSGSDYDLFVKSHDSLRPGMTLQEVFEAGLADYLAQMGIKNVPGGTLAAREPVSADCARHVLDISHYSSPPWSASKFQVRVYCGRNEPSARQLVPEKSFKTKDQFLKALGAEYGSWARSMEFRVESPPQKLWGVYDYYVFTLDARGRVEKVSTVIVAKR